MATKTIIKCKNKNCWKDNERNVEIVSDDSSGYKLPTQRYADKRPLKCDFCGFELIWKPEY